MGGRYTPGGPAAGDLLNQRAFDVVAKLPEWAGGQLPQEPKPRSRGARRDYSSGSC